MCIRDSVGSGVTIESNGQATFVGVVTFGSSSTTIEGDNNVIKVGTALTLGHTQGLQFHTQNLHSTGFEVNNLNVSGVSTFTGNIDANGNLDVNGYVRVPDGNESSGGRVEIGNSRDLRIYHAGHNYYYSSGPSHLFTYGTQALAQFVPNSSARLFFSGSKKFETASTGAVVTGILTATNFAKEDGTPIASTDIAINTLSSSSATGGGSASFNGTAYRFTLSEPPDTSVYQLFVSINGVIQKPNAGSSQPSEGFAIDGNDIIFGSPPPAGSPFFIQTFKTVGISSIPPQAQVSTTSAAKSVKNVTTSTSAPTNSNGVDGDLWFTYIA